jgi:molecular chaperone GrpE
MTKKRTSSRTIRTVSPKKTEASKSLKPAIKESKVSIRSQTSVDRAAISSGKGSSASQPGAKSAEVSAAELLARIEGDITGVISVLNNQMNAALSSVSELAQARSGDHARAVVRTAPLDRATATFKRLVAEMVDDQLAEMLPPLIGHRNEIAYAETENSASNLPEEFRRRAVETLDHVLVLAGVQSYDARAGESFDPLIHLAVAEIRREDLPNGTIVEQIQRGFRSSRGKILVPAKVRVNRR